MEALTEKRKLQLVLTEITKDVVKICEQNNIEYFMTGGTLLGAIRHNGFIPWDDDIDLGMTRENYEKFIKACEKDLDSEKYFLQTSVTEKYYAYDFAKIRLRGTRLVEDFSKNADIQHGIFVDVFPFDNIPDGKLSRKLFLFENKLFRNMSWIKCGYGTEERSGKLVNRVIKVIANMYSLETIKEKRSRLVTRYRGKKTSQVFISDFPECIDNRSWYDEFADYNFEGQLFKGPKDYDAVLRATYGDNYMELPPVEQRMEHTNYKIDFGKYT